MTVRVVSPAIEEIAEAAIWYDSKAPGLGEEFWQLVDHALTEIASHPIQRALAEANLRLLKSTCVTCTYSD